MQSIIGESGNNQLLIRKKVNESQEIHVLDVSGRQSSTNLLFKRTCTTKSVVQASIQDLFKDQIKSQSLLSLVYKENLGNETESGSTEAESGSTEAESGSTEAESGLFEAESGSFEASLFLIENLIQNFSNSPNQEEKHASIVILEEILLVKSQETNLQVHILPPNPKETDTSIPLALDTPCLPTPIGCGADIVVLRNKVIALSLGECITIYDIETTLSTSAGSKIEIISSDFIAKSFWWSQWVPQGNFLAFAHYRKIQHSSIEEEVSISVISKPILSIFQFRGNLPQETVLNLPLRDVDSNDHRRGSVAHPSQLISLLPNPNIMHTGLDKFRILAHASGHVSILQIQDIKDKDTKNASIIYKLNALHHNKTLLIKANTRVTEPLFIDTCLFHNGQFVAVMAKDHFLHLLDVGVEHEPSHHLILDWSSLTINPEINLMRIFANVNVSQSQSLQIPANHSANTQLVLLDETQKKTELEINSALLIPMLLKQKPDINFSFAVIHYLVIHLSDVNAVKKVIYEMGKSLSSPYLTEIFQEFVIAHSHLMTNKHLMPNMKIFLHFLPYSSQITKSMPIVQHNEKPYSIEILDNSSTVATILLSPRQRILPQSAVDIWTQLWEVNGLLSKSSRFCHRSVAQKLLLSLQCYQPEALSRATTPMSPSSPMVCNSLGDIAALFGRRTSDLQLPFVEHESCTANKQEYVYSNLRELSTHLLKERRDWPLHGHTVAGKYMNSLVESARLLCHLTCLCLHLQPNRKCKGFNLIDSLSWNVRLKLFMLFEHMSIALGTLACPLPQGFTPFFAYLGYTVLKYDQFLWHVRSGTFDLQIDLVKTIMTDLNDKDDDNVSKKLHLISLLPKSRGTRVRHKLLVLNSWSHQVALCLRARQHSSDLLSGVTSVGRKTVYATSRMKLKGAGNKDTVASPLDTFLQLLTAKAKVADIDLGLLAEATMLSMQLDD